MLHIRIRKKDVFWGLPVEWSHREVVVLTLSNSELFLKVCEVIELVASICDMVDPSSYILNASRTKGAFTGSIRMFCSLSEVNQPLNYSLALQQFTLQDAIEFAEFVISATINSMKFQKRPKTVGGPIDILIIKPENAFWLQRKELHP